MYRKWEGLMLKRSEPSCTENVIRCSACHLKTKVKLEAIDNQLPHSLCIIIRLHDYYGPHDD